MVSVGRHIIAPDRTRVFEDKFNDVKGLLEELALPYVARGAWKMREDAESGNAEWVLVAGWPCVDRHLDFEKHESWVRFRELMNVVARFEARHCRRFL